MGKSLKNACLVKWDHVLYDSIHGRFLEKEVYKDKNI
jgi:hypothetical protein